MRAAARGTLLLRLGWMLLIAGRAAAWGGWAPAAAAPKFAVVPSQQAREGRGHLDSLQQGADTEGFLDRILGTDCFSQAVAQLTADCRRMEQEAKTRLALALMNCQLAVQQAHTYPCHRRHSIKECTEALSDRAHAHFVEFLTHVDSMCLYIQNQNFEKYTENMLDRLAEGAGFAKEQLATVARSTGQLSKDTSALHTKAEAALGLLQEHRELEEESLKLQRAVREEAAEYFASLDAKQQRNLELQDEAIKKQAALEAGQQAALVMLEEAEGHMGGLFELVEARASDLAAAAGQQAEAQRQLAGELGGLLDSSRGIRSAVDVVISYQQRSDSVLMRLLGKSYTLEDVGFYAAGTLAALAAGTSPATARAKLPVMALMGVSLLGERMLLDRLHMLMDIDEAGQIILRLPVPGLLRWLPGAPASPLQLNFKWTVRWATAVLGAAMLLFSLLSFRDFERENYRLLKQFEEDQKRRHEEFMALLHRQKVELAAMLGGAGMEALGARAVGSIKGKVVPIIGKQQAVAATVGRQAEADEEEEEPDTELQQSKCISPHGPAAAAQVATPASKSGRRAAASPAKQPSGCWTAAAPVARKRGASHDTGAAAKQDLPIKRRAATQSTEDAAEAMAVDANNGQHAGSGRQRVGKRTRRGSADMPAASGDAGAPAKRRQARRS